MPALWIVIAVSILVSVICTVYYARRASRVSDLGMISELWIAQHRAGSRDSPS